MAKRLTKRKVVEEPASEADEDDDEEAVPESKSAKKRKTTAAKVKLQYEDDSEVEAEEAPKPAAKKRKTPAKSKAKSSQDTMPLAERTVISSLKKAMYIGAHVSAAGGVQNAITNAVQIGANSFALFLKSQRKWDSPPLAADARTGFETLSKQHSFEVHKHCLPHGSYLVNLAAAEAAKADQAYRSFVDDLQRCEALGVRLYNFHPGNTNGEAREAAVGRIASQLNKAHKATEKVVTVLENMAGQGNVVGSTFEDLRDIIALVEDKSRVGVCIDTCHAFAAGYDLRTPAAYADTMGKFDDVVGYGYLKAFHLNDSKAPMGSHRDLHANIGTGFLGLRAFHNVMNHGVVEGLPMVLETPIDRKGPDGKTVEDKKVWADEIKLLESLIGMDPESDEFKALDERLQTQGESERVKVQDQVDRKAVKDSKKGTKGKRGKKKAADDNDSDSD
ncbi:xylose isomerase-like protein [Pseudomassariella vexata]|uniref:Apurinic-apyrimidinic endonuclease 1 n=1 Tax=Pseudomassariella vexata TaxID=1141098 RepID=A0A1Y2DSQ8_9PEZI|nr:xylose isomerase-like protein [Pseudomassariella vexata]ORY62313.1 xylose isomerase-like protein [Pseudomassariella vexata]